jgi:hypothetical protein
MNFILVFEVPNILALLIDVPLDGFLGEYRKPDALVLHVRGHLHAAKDFTLADLVPLNRVAAPADFLAVSIASALNRIPQMPEPGTFSKTPRPCERPFSG